MSTQASVSPPTPASPVSPTPSSGSSATITPNNGSLASLMSAATQVVSAHSQSHLDVPTTPTPQTMRHSRSRSLLLHRSRSQNQLLAPPDADSGSTHHHRRFSLRRHHSSHSRARSHSRHDAAQLAHADFIADCEARVREKYPEAGEEEIRRRVEEEVDGGWREAEDFAKEVTDEDEVEEERRREKWAAVRAL